MSPRAHAYTCVCVVKLSACANGRPLFARAGTLGRGSGDTARRCRGKPWLGVVRWKTDRRTHSVSLYRPPTRPVPVSVWTAAGKRHSITIIDRANSIDTIRTERSNAQVQVRTAIITHGRDKPTGFAQSITGRYDSTDCVRI